MSWSFNPFTGNLDLVGSGGGTVVFEGEVETFAELPETVGNPAVGASYLVKSSTGVWLVSRKQAGIWIRRYDTGVRATDWEYGGDYPVNSVNGQTGNVSLTADQVSAAWALTVASNLLISADTTLTAGRNVQQRVQTYSATNLNLTLPTSGLQNGDTLTIIAIAENTGDIVIRRRNHDGSGFGPEFTVLATATLSGAGERFTFRTNGTISASWELLPVDTHTHAASAITSGALIHERGGLEADVSAYSGLLKISGGATSAVTTTATGESVIGAADAAAARSAISAAAATHTHPSTDITGLAASATTDTTNASNITSGTLAPARMGTGTPSASNYLRGDGSWQTVAAGGVTSGSVDNAVLRADGTGGSTSQSSDLIVDDPVVAFACTGDASTDIITAVGHNFVDGQRIRFQSLTGGSGLFFGGPASSTNYFVRDVSGSTFRISTSSGGAAVNFTTNITAGAVLAVQRNLTLRTRKQAFAMTADAATDVITATGHTFVNGDAVSFYNLTGGNNLDEVSRWYVIEAATNTFKVSNSLNGTARDITTSYTGGTVELEIPLVLGLPRFSSLILGDKPDGNFGGNVRGYGAVDLQTNRNGPNAIASGNFSFIGGGQSNTASATRAIVLGGSNNTASATDSTVAGGETNAASAQWSFVAGGTGNASNGVTAFTAGASNTATGGQSAVPCGRNANADRDNVLAQASGRFAAQGDAQTIRVSLRNRVSTATAVELFMGFSADTRFPIPSGKTMSALINIIAATSGGEFANRYVRAVTIANRGGTTALRGAVKEIETEEQINGADVTISANDTNDAIRIEFSGVAPVTGCTGTASTDRINKVAHGYSNNDDIVFTSLTGGAGLTANTVTYWVINANADDFQVSANRGGAAVNITTDYTDMTAARLFRVVAGIDAVEVGHGT